MELAIHSTTLQTPQQQENDKRMHLTIIIWHAHWMPASDCLWQSNVDAAHNRPILIGLGHLSMLEGRVLVLSCCCNP